MRPIRRILIAVAASAWTAALALLFGAVATGCVKGAEQESAHAAPRFPITQTSPGQVIDGKYPIHAFPWDYNGSGGVKPDYFGPDTPYKFDGVVKDGDQSMTADVRINNIPGKAFWMKGSVAGGSLGLPRARDIFVHSAIWAYWIDATDFQVDHLNASNIVKDNLVINGGGNGTVDTIHFWGGDRGAVVNSPVTGHTWYLDNQRHGAEFLPGSDGSTVDGMIIRGCFERGVLIAANGVSLSGIRGDARAPSVEHPESVGLEILPGLVHETISGFWMVEPRATGIIAHQGDRNRIRVDGGGWNNPQPDSTYLKIDGKHTKSAYYVRGYCNGGTVVDATTAQLDETDLIEEWIDGPCERIVGDTGKATVIIHEIKK